MYDFVKKKGCDMLLVERYERKINSKRADSIMNRLNIAQPVKRDNKIRNNVRKAEIRILNDCAKGGGLLEDFFSRREGKLVYREIKKSLEKLYDLEIIIK